ncbi:hypothetical protein [Bradyrhizobium sp. UFLA05-109]
MSIARETATFLRAETHCTRAFFWGAGFATFAWETDVGPTIRRPLSKQGLHKVFSGTAIAGTVDVDPRQPFAF